MKTWYRKLWLSDSSFVVTICEVDKTAKLMNINNPKQMFELKYSASKYDAQYLEEAEAIYILKDLKNNKLPPIKKGKYFYSPHFKQRSFELK